MYYQMLLVKYESDQISLSLWGSYICCGQIRMMRSLSLSLSLSYIYIISFIISFRRHNQIERSSIFSLCFLIECGCKTDTLLGAILTNLVVTLLGMTMDMLQFCFSFIFFFLSFNVTWYRSRVFFLYEWYAGCF